MTRNRSIALALLAIVALGAGAYLAYDNVLRGDSTPALALPSGSPAASASAEPSASDAAASADPSASTDPGTSAEPGTAGDVAGTWTVASGSQAGYRVREQLANLPAESDAVGRTEDVTGTHHGRRRGRRGAADRGHDRRRHHDDHLRRGPARQSTALGRVSRPTSSRPRRSRSRPPSTCRQPPSRGRPRTSRSTGDLTLHGVTKTVEIPAQAQLADGQIQVVGAVTFALADFEIVAPNIGGFIVSIADEGTLEFLAIFEKA